MLCKMLKGKIHRARVTDACLEYEGSITIDPILLEAAGLLPNEAVQIWNLANGERFETYTVSGARGTGEICINGAAARKVSVGDQIIIAGFTWMEAEAARRWEPRVVLVDEANRVGSAPPVRAAASG